MNTFESFQLPTEISLALKKNQFINPTPIQAATIPLAMQGRDLIGAAQTGTGKTIAFLIPILTQMHKKPGTTALIMAPTRDLCAQIAEVLRSISTPAMKVRHALLIGGVSMNKQFSMLDRDPSFLIATPGRLNDHLERGSVNLSGTSIVVLDEVDRMLDMGFLPQVEKILQHLPKQRQNLFFSATMPNTLKRLTDRFTRNAEYVSVGSEKPAEKIKTTHVKVAGTLKNEEVLKEVKRRAGSVLIFARTKIRADRLSRYLKTNGVKAIAIHSGRTQSQRKMALANFISREYLVLVATDIASRGLDIPDIELVLNFDLPQTREDYIHRIGRTARGSAEGEALSFVTPDEMPLWNYISTNKGPNDKPFNPGKPKSFGGGSNGQRNSGGPRGSHAGGAPKKKFGFFKKSKTKSFFGKRKSAAT